jgi:hypothetical protein
MIMKSQELLSLQDHDHESQGKSFRQATRIRSLLKTPSMAAQKTGRQLGGALS